MNLGTNLHGRLRNTSLPTGNGLLPVFEAVANAIHSIEDAQLSANNGRIKIQIIRDTQAVLSLEKSQSRPGPKIKSDISGFKITDNGIGFTDENMTSFLTLDSEHKASRGGRGVGRLLWLKAFNRARIESVYQDETKAWKNRTFDFNSTIGVSDPVTNDSESKKLTTTVYLNGFVHKYREAAPKTAIKIASDLFEHCLWYFLRSGGAPQILIFDGDETIDLNTVYDEHMISSATPESIVLKDITFDLVHIKLSASVKQTHSIAFCAANRLVKQESIKGKIPGLYGNLSDSAGDFTYQCYISSSLLDERVRSERTSFDIEEEPLGMFSSSELSQKEIREMAISRAKEFLKDYLEEKKKLGQDRVKEFVSTKAPRYRPIINLIPEENLAIDPAISDKDLDLVLHKYLAEIESKMLADGHDILNPQGIDDVDDYRKRVREYLQTAEDIKKSDLAGYVSHRRVIIDLLELAIQRKPDGKYVKEELIHNLIMPVRQDSDETPSGSCNLWLIDERLAFHDYLASDKPLSSMPITDSASGKEPDILALNVFDNPLLVSEGNKLPLASLVVVELKRPMRDGAKQGEGNDPIEQALGYLDRIRQGKVTTASGRLIPKSEQIPGFCYVLCDLTPSILKRCKMHDAIRTSDGLGYFFYHKTYGAYVEVISFDRLVNSAKERNRAFFDKLGLPVS